MHWHAPLTQAGVAEPAAKQVVTEPVSVYDALHAWKPAALLTHTFELGGEHCGGVSQLFPLYPFCVRAHCVSASNECVILGLDDMIRSRESLWEERETKRKIKIEAEGRKEVPVQTDRDGERHRRWQTQVLPDRRA